MRNFRLRKSRFLKIKIFNLLEEEVLMVRLSSIRSKRRRLRIFRRR